MSKLVLVFIAVLTLSLLIRLSSDETVSHDGTPSHNIGNALADDSRNDSASNRPETKTEHIALGIELSPPDSSLKTIDLPVRTKFGILELKGEDRSIDPENQLTLYYNGHKTNLRGAFGVELGTLYALGDDTIAGIVSINDGGNRCVGTYHAIFIDERGFRNTDEIGDCGFIKVANTGSKGVLVEFSEISYLMSKRGIEAVKPDQLSSIRYEVALDNASNDSTTLVSPLVIPDRKLYRWCGVLMRFQPNDDGSKALLAKFGDNFFLGVIEKLRPLDVSKLRLNSMVCLTGVYVLNSELGRVTAPTLLVHRASNM